MKKWVSVLTVINSVIFLAFIFYAFVFKSDKTAFVDSSKLVNGYQGMALARKEYQAKVAVWKANIDTLVKDLQVEISKYEKESPRMTTREKELTKKLIQTKQQQVADYQRATNDKASQEDAAATKKILDEVNAYIKEYGKNHNYTIIQAATEYGNIAYAEEHLDITEQVLRGLNERYTNPKSK